MWVKGDVENGITNNIQEICMTEFPRYIATKKHIVRSIKTYHSNHRYNIHKHINKNTYVTMTQWWNNTFT